MIMNYGGSFFGGDQMKVSMSVNVARNGKFACRYPDTHIEQHHDLFLEDYGVNKMWVLVTRK